MTGNAGGLSLYGLSTANLKPFRGGIRVQRHVLCLEGRRTVAVLTEDAAEGGSDNALADVAARTGKHDWVQLMVCHSSFRAKPA